MKIDLRQKNLREVPAGTIVTTNNGYDFEFVSKENGKESWKDLTSGLIWHDVKDWKGNHYEAMEKFKDKLPTKKEFEEAERHGFREVLPNIKDKWFWSSSVHPDNSYNAFYFNGYYGVVYYVSRGFNYFSARCVGR